MQEDLSLSMLVFRETQLLTKKYGCANRHADRRQFRPPKKSSFYDDLKSDSFLSAQADQSISSSIESFLILANTYCIFVCYYISSDKAIQQNGKKDFKIQTSNKVGYAEKELCCFCFTFQKTICWFCFTTSQPSCNEPTLGGRSAARKSSQAD